MAGSSDFPRLDSNCAAIFNSEDVRRALVELLAPLHKKIEEGKTLTSEETAQYNKALRNTIRTQLDGVANKISDKLELRPEDSPETKKAKSIAGNAIHTYLSDVTDWLIKTVENVFQKLVQGVQWCYEQLKNAFQKLYDVWGLTN